MKNDIVMPILQGKELHEDLLARYHYKDLNAPSYNDLEKLDIAIGICNIVQGLHGRGTIHADLKPENIMIDSKNGTKVLTLIDFGLSKKLKEGELSVQDWASGTPSFMAPEIKIAFEIKELGKKKVEYTTASDVYAVGKILREVGLDELDGFNELNHTEVYDSRNIAYAMTHEDPKKRSSLADTITDLQELRDLLVGKIAEKKERAEEKQAKSEAYKNEISTFKNNNPNMGWFAQKKLALRIQLGLDIVPKTKERKVYDKNLRTIQSKLDSIEISSLDKFKEIHKLIKQNNHLKEEYKLSDRSLPEYIKTQLSQSLTRRIHFKINQIQLSDFGMDHEKNLKKIDHIKELITIQADLVNTYKIGKFEPTKMLKKDIINQVKNKLEDKKGGFDDRTKGNIEVIKRRLDEIPAWIEKLTTPSSVSTTPLPKGDAIQGRFSELLSTPAGPSLNLGNQRGPSILPSAKPGVTVAPAAVAPAPVLAAAAPAAASTPAAAAPEPSFAEKMGRQNRFAGVTPPPLPGAQPSETSLLFSSGAKVAGGQGKAEAEKGVKKAEGVDSGVEKDPEHSKTMGAALK